MTSSYGVGVTNRYQLFCMDDDGNDSFDSISIKTKQKKSAAAAAAGTATGTFGGVGTTNVGGPPPPTTKQSTAEKENKIGGAQINSKNAHSTDSSNKLGGGGGQKYSTPATGGSQSNGQQKSTRPIKETQNIRGNLDRNTREGQWQKKSGKKNSMCLLCAKNEERNEG